MSQFFASFTLYSGLFFNALVKEKSNFVWTIIIIHKLYIHMHSKLKSSNHARTWPSSFRVFEKTWKYLKISDNGCRSSWGCCLTCPSSNFRHFEPRGESYLIIKLLFPWNCLKINVIMRSISLSFLLWKISCCSLFSVSMRPHFY